MQRRVGWLEDTERQAQLEALPDVSDKMTTCAEEESAQDEPAAPPPPPASSFAELRPFGSTPEGGGSSTTY
jgi:hypothetical protein